MTSVEIFPVTKELYNEMSKIAWIMFLPAFSLSCAIEYVKKPLQFPALDLLKRVFITALLLSCFPTISSTIADVSHAVVEHVAEKQAMDKVYAKLEGEGDPGKQATSAPSIFRSDFGVGLISYICYALAFIARILMTAIYHFLWSLLTCLSPLMILCGLFPGLTHITKNLFATLIEISLWDLIWQIMGTMLLGSSLGFMEGRTYFDSMCFNLLLAVTMFKTPHLVSSLIKGNMSGVVGSGVSAMTKVAAGSAQLAMTATMAMGGVPKVPKGGKS